MLTSAAEHGDLIRHRAADFLMPDAPRVGGITPFLKIAAQAEQAGLMLGPHFAMELHVHLGAAYPTEPWVEHFDWLEPLFNERLEIKNGRMIVPTRPGLGVSAERSRPWPGRAKSADGRQHRRLSIARAADHRWPTPKTPLTIRMHERDNVAIVANDGGLPRRHRAALRAWCCATACRRATRWRWSTSPPMRRVLRYGIPIGYALKAIPAGSWVHERLLKMPAARGLDGLPIATVKPAAQPPLDGYTFEGYRNADGSVGTRNILAITTTVQCVAGVLDFAVKRIKAELLPQYPNVDDVVGAGAQLRLRRRDRRARRR